MLIRALLLACFCLPCFATELRICADNRNVPPLLYVDGMGMAQFLLPEAAEALGLSLSIIYRPQPRCLYEAQLGNFDGVMTVSPNPQTAPYVTVPLNELGKPDSSFAFMKLNVVAFRPKGSKALWNGQEFLGLKLPVLYESGVPAVNMFMEKLPGPSRASARTPIHMMQMMRLGRADIAVGLEPAVRYALLQNDSQNEFEILSPPLFSSDIYLGLGRPFVAKHPQLATQLWAEIRRQSNRPEWQRIRQQVMHNQLPPTLPLEHASLRGQGPIAKAP